jgi:ABC-type glycerol-3-phosphate transport system substrate-binding protein
MRPRMTLAALAVALLGLTACGGNKDEPSAPQDVPAVAASGQACKLVTAAEATEAVGGGQLTLANDSEDGCAYESSDRAKTVDLKVETIPFDAAQVDQLKSALDATQTTDLRGLGDAAFSYHPSEDITSIYVWGKGHFLQILVAIEGGKTSDAAMKLTQTAFGRI